MSDTIFALATPAGQSAIAIIRVSGSRAAAIALSLSGKAPRHRMVQPALLKDEAGEALDDAMLLYLHAPATPTGEDILEIHCHGSLSVVRAVSAYLARQDGVRPAQAGEFTKRAFDHGKMDLTEVEGLADLIEAQTESQRRQALGQLKGEMRRKAMMWREEIISLSARLESVIDFSDEDLPDTILASIDEKRTILRATLLGLLQDAGRGEMIRQGVRVSLLGAVNVGKSTALNALAGRSAAIVSDEAGTTRDIVEVRLDLDGVAVILQDTAGIRDEAGHVETIGMTRAISAAQEADLVILMADASNNRWHQETEALLSDITCPVIKVLNKSDMAADSTESHDYMALSLHNESDVGRLEEVIAGHIAPLNHSDNTLLITRERHRFLVSKAYDALCASEALSLNEAPELVAEELRIAADALGQMTGHIDVEDVLSDIFSAFCIGK